MVNNGSLSYDHDRDGTHTQLAGCEGRFRNVNFDTHITIRYENNILSVSTDFENKGEWKSCFVVQSVELPTGYYFGVSATTGDLSDNHDIYSFKFYDLDVELTVMSNNLRTNIIITEHQFLNFSTKKHKLEKPSYQKHRHLNHHENELKMSNQECPMPKYFSYYCLECLQLSL